MDIAMDALWMTLPVFIIFILILTPIVIVTVMLIKTWQAKIYGGKEEAYKQLAEEAIQFQMKTLENLKETAEELQVLKKREQRWKK